MDEFNDHFTGRHAKLIAHLVGGRRTGGIGQSQTDGLGNRRHGIGGELRTAGTG